MYLLVKKTVAKSSKKHITKQVP